MHRSLPGILATSAQEWARLGRPRCGPPAPGTGPHVQWDIASYVLRPSALAVGLGPRERAGIANDHDSRDLDHSPGSDYDHHCGAVNHSGYGDDVHLGALVGRSCVLGRLVRPAEVGHPQSDRRGDAEGVVTRHPAELLDGLVPGFMAPRSSATSSSTVFS